MAAIDKEQLAKMASSRFDDVLTDMHAWCKANDVSTERLKETATADGTFEWGGAIGGVLVADLTFGSGHNLKFTGKFVGEVVGGAAGVCHYRGARPNPLADDGPLLLLGS